MKSRGVLKSRPPQKNTLIWLSLNLLLQILCETFSFLESRCCFFFSYNTIAQCNKMQRTQTDSVPLSLQWRCRVAETVAGVGAGGKIWAGSQRTAAGGGGLWRWWWGGLAALRSPIKPTARDDAPHLTRRPQA